MASSENTDSPPGFSSSSFGVTTGAHRLGTVEYEFRTRQFTSDDLADHPWYPAWASSVNEGFHQVRPSDAFLRHQLAVEAGHRATARGAYATTQRASALPADHPVATFTEWTGSLNIGRALVDVHQISDVTVRPTHRRRGLLRRLMTDSLTHAHGMGLPIAALTASEATIYGRFGFGPAVFVEQVELRVDGDFRLTTGLRGTVELLDPAHLDDVTTSVFERFHRLQTGSIARFPADHGLHLGAIDETRREPDDRLRAAAHWDDEGTIDGYVTWVAGEQSGEVRVKDFITCTEEARLALWHFLGSLDLIRTVHAHGMRVGDPLPWSLADRRRYRTKAVSDFIWLRVLDTPAVLMARDYVHDGAVALRVLDPLGFAEGCWRLEVRDGAASVEPAEHADVEVDVAALGSSILDGVRISTLESAGLIRGERGAVDTLESLLSRRRAPWCATGF